jgi:hypothetical protein
MPRPGWLAGIWDWLEPAEAFDEDITELREQFYVTLRSYFARIQASGQPRSPEAFARVQALLDPKRPQQRWSDCYEVEQLMVHLFDDAMLQTELSVRLLEAQSNLRPQQADFYRTEAAKAESDRVAGEKSPSDKAAADRAAGVPARERTLLARLVNDLQWRYTLNEAKRRFTKSLTSRTSYIFVITLAVFAALVLFKFWSLGDVGRGDPKLLFVAMVVGAWGAGFSMLTGLKGRIEASELYDLNLMRAYMMLVSRALIGAGAASIFYFFLLSGLLSGKAFPELEAKKIEAQAPASGGAVVVTGSPLAPGTPAPAPRGPDRPCSNGQPCLTFTDISLLIVWCFIAGFSEKLVPGLLARTEARLDSEQGQGSDRLRPTESSRPSTPATGDTGKKDQGGSQTSGEKSSPG